MIPGAAEAAHLAYYGGSPGGLPPWIKTWQQLTLLQKREWETFVLAVTDPQNGCSDAARIDAGRRSKRYMQRRRWRDYSNLSRERQWIWKRTLDAVDAAKAAPPEGGNAQAEK